MYLALARQRLRWYLRTTGNLVLQHWQVVALACLIVPGPPFIAIFLQLAAFLQSPVSPALDVAQRFALALAIDGAAVLWLAPQRHALSGGPFAHYLATLPLPKGVMLAVEGTLLTVANGLIVIAAIIAAARMAAAGASGYAFCYFAVLLGGAVITQRAVLDRRFRALFGIIACDVALAVGMSSNAMAMRALGWSAPWPAQARVSPQVTRRLPFSSSAGRCVRDPRRPGCGSAPPLRSRSEQIA